VFVKSPATLTITALCAHLQQKIECTVSLNQVQVDERERFEMEVVLKNEVLLKMQVPLFSIQMFSA